MSLVCRAELLEPFDWAVIFIITCRCSTTVILSLFVYSSFVSKSSNMSVTIIVNYTVCMFIITVWCGDILRSSLSSCSPSSTASSSPSSSSVLSQHPQQQHSCYQVTTQQHLACNITHVSGFTLMLHGRVKLKHLRWCPRAEDKSSRWG